MSSSKTAETHPEFLQDEYDNTFYYCDKDHPFIVFTTCYCPLCEVNDNKEELLVMITDTESELDELRDNHCDLLAKVLRHSPELVV